MNFVVACTSEIITFHYEPGTTSKGYPNYSDFYVDILSGASTLKVGV
jgi:hypothetical protein